MQVWQQCLTLQPLKKGDYRKKFFDKDIKIFIGKAKEGKTLEISKLAKGHEQLKDLFTMKSLILAQDER